MGEATYQAIQEKMEQITFLSLDSLVISEYNTRCSFVDNEHVEHLVNLIKERGFHRSPELTQIYPKR